MKIIQNSPFRYCVLFIILLFYQNFFAQRFPTRNLLINPFWVTNTESPSVYGWAEFGLYRLIRDNDHSWLQKLGFVVDLSRTETSIFSGESSIEFISDPHNDISFNPRAIFWEEGFFFTQKLKKNFLQLGYYHRCKHDIDNLGLKEERTLIYGSFNFKYIFDRFLFNQLDNALQIRLDIFTFKYDHRKPKNLLKNRIDQLAATTGFNFVMKEELNRNISFVLKSYFMLSLFSENKNLFKQFAEIKSIQPSFGISSGISIGQKSKVDLLFNFELLSDTGISVVPTKSNLFSFSLLFIDKRIF